MIKLEKHQSGNYSVYTKTGQKYLGSFEPMEDGFYVYWPSDNLSGCYTAELLKSLASALDEINKSWQNNELNSLSPTSSAHANPAG